jgi:hypothetical protein
MTRAGGLLFVLVVRLPHAPTLTEIARASTLPWIPSATLVKVFTSSLNDRFDRIEQMASLYTHTLLERLRWTPIRNCPGRFVLRTADFSMPLEALLGRACHAREFITDRARDRVLVVPLEDGGLISYARADGRLVHTLNTAEGFARKLSQLGITLERVDGE